MPVWRALALTLVLFLPAASPQCFYNPVLGVSKVVLTKSGSFAMAEVQVFNAAGTNLARSASVASSSCYTATPCAPFSPGGCCTPAAVDGSYGTFWSSGSESNPSYTVTVNANVASFHVVPRQDCCSDQVLAKVSFLSSTGATLYTYTITSQASGGSGVGACSCPIGSYCPGGTAISPCGSGPGYYCGPTGALAPEFCPAGSFCPASNVKSLCPLGTYSAAQGATSCTPCPAGTGKIATLGLTSLAECMSSSPAPSVSPVRTSLPSATAPISSVTATPAPSDPPSATNFATATPAPSDPPSATAPWSSSPSGFPTASPSDSSQASPTATLTATPSNSPPPFSCISNPAGGCLAPSSVLALPRATNGALLSSLNSSSSSGSLLVAFPAVYAPFSVTLPMPPSMGEATSLTCAPPPGSALAVVAAEDTLQSGGATGCPRGGGRPPLLPGAACIQIPSRAQPSSTPGVSSQQPQQGLGKEVLSFLFTLHATAPSTIPAATVMQQVTCTLASTPLALSVASGLPFPHYGLSTALVLPVTIAPLSLPLLSAVLKESELRFGDFTCLGGACTLGAVALQLPALNALASACPGGPLDAFAQSVNASTASFWTRASTIQACPAAAAAITSAAAAVLTADDSGSSSGGGGGGDAPLAATLSGMRHLLLLASPLTPFPVQAGVLQVMLGAAPCAVNWVLPSIASVTTPPLAQLCTTNASLASGDCGLAPLMLSFSRAPTSTGGSGTAAASASAYVPLDALYFPLSPLGNWSPALAVESGTLASTSTSFPDPATSGPTTGGDASTPLTPLAQAAALVGLPWQSSLAVSLAATPAGMGIRVVSRCTDPQFAPPEECTVVNTSYPFLNASSGRVCVWGSGDACLPCPLGALCPGGAVLLILPGFWAPMPSSPPSELYPCSPPADLERCPGYTKVPSLGGVYGCGTGYRGQMCSACDTGYFPLRGTCAACPRGALVTTLLVPILVFIAGLGGLGVLLTVLLYARLRASAHAAASQVLSARTPTPSAPTAEKASSATNSATWSTAAAPVGSLLVWCWISAQGLASLFTQAQSLAPPSLGGYFAAVSALQFQGLTLNPACFSSDPFFSFYAALGAVGVAGMLAAAAAALLLRESGGKSCATNSTAAANAILTVSTLAATVGYGAATSEFASALVCRRATPVTVQDYLQMIQDGSALRAHFSATPPSQLALLGAASRNPLLAFAYGLSDLLRTTFPVSVLASNPFHVCGEAGHRVVLPLAATVVVLYSLGLPLGVYFATGLVGGGSKGAGGSWRNRCCRLFNSRSFFCCCKRTPPAAALTSYTPRTIQGATPFNAALSGALADPTLLPSAAWFSSLQMLHLALVTALVAMLKGNFATSVMLACQGIILASSLAMAALLLCRRLHVAREAWRWPVMALLYCVMAVTAGINALLNVVDATTLSTAQRTSLALVPLGLAAFTGVTLFVSWLHSLSHVLILPGSGAAAEEGDEKAAVGGDTEARLEGEGLPGTLNPMHTPGAATTIAAPPISAANDSGVPGNVGGECLWRRSTDAEGCEYWWQPSTGASAWEVPYRGSTLCGWHYVVSDNGEGSYWVHSASGAVTPVPPPLKLRRAERLIRKAREKTMREVEEGRARLEEVAAAGAQVALAETDTSVTAAQEAANSSADRGGGVVKPTLPPFSTVVQPPLSSTWWENDAWEHSSVGREGKWARVHKDEVAGLVDRARLHRDVLAAVVEHGGFKTRPGSAQRGVSE